jgi:hypothetical protein
MAIKSLFRCYHVGGYKDTMLIETAHTSNRDEE